MGHIYKVDSLIEFFSYLRVNDRKHDHLFKGLNPLQLELSIIVDKTQNVNWF